MPGKYDAIIEVMRDAINDKRKLPLPYPVSKSTYPYASGADEVMCLHSTDIGGLSRSIEELYAEIIHLEDGERVGREPAVVYLRNVLSSVLNHPWKRLIGSDFVAPYAYVRFRDDFIRLLCLYEEANHAR